MQNIDSASRRDFIKTSAMLGAAGVGAAFMPSFLQGAQMSKDRVSILNEFIH